MHLYRLAVWCICLGLLNLAAASAKEPPPLVIVWPSSGQPVVRFSFGKLKETGSSGKQHEYMTDVTAEIPWNKRISKTEFALCVFDKAKVRIGESWVAISDVAPGGILQAVTKRKVLPFDLFSRHSAQLFGRTLFVRFSGVLIS